MKRVEITQPVVGIYAMQVCAVGDATDEEILEVCNRDNRSGTSLGWVRVIRDREGDNKPNNGPVACADHPNRTHFLIEC